MLRFVAFLLVFVHHIPSPGTSPIFWRMQPASGFGVCIFFLLSAYLITELLQREQDKTGTIHVRQFFIRRALRIWPLYFLSLGLGLLSSAGLSAWPLPWKAAVWFSLLGGNLYVAHVGWPASPTSVLWSLSVEEQFYLFIPLLAKYGGRRALAWISGACISASYATLYLLGRMGAVPQRQVWVNSFVQFQFFAAGVLLALILHRKHWTLSSLKRACLFLGGLVSFVLADRLLHLQSFKPVAPVSLMAGYSVVLASTISIFLALLHSVSSWWKFLSYFGRISFGLYIFHSYALQLVFYPSAEKAFWQVARLHPLLCDAIAFLLTLSAAAVSYRFYELPINRLKSRFAYVASGDPAAGRTREALTG